MIPRDYQVAAMAGMRAEIGAALRNKQRPSLLVVMPTGSGKTVIAAMVIEGACDKGKKVLFLAHRRELIHQTADKLRRFGVHHGIIMAGEETTYSAPVQVASVDTLRSWAMDRDRIVLPPADVVFIDEAHRSLSPTYRKLANYYLSEGASLLGLTATPIRSDGTGMGHVYDRLYVGPSVQSLTDQGHLVPARYYAPSVPDLKGIRIQAGDYNQKQLGRRMDKAKLVGDVVSHWLKYGENRPTIVFAAGVKHSIHLRDAFVGAGVRAAHIDGTTELEDREAVWEAMRSGELDVVCNCMVATEGFDLPRLSCAILARPTKSLGLFLQMGGRVLRPDENKADAILIDHSGAVYEHGFLEDARDWSLDADGETKEQKAQEKEDREKIEITCEECKAVFRGQHCCPHCGHINAKKGRAVATVEGELVAVKGKKEPTMEEKRAFYNGLLVSKYRPKSMDGQKLRKWAAWRYRDKFGVWPRGIPENPAPCKDADNWVIHERIKWQKSRASAV